MKPDREPNRLPLRAGAMLLFAVAIVFIGLGWHSAATSGNDSSGPVSTAGEQQNQQPAETTDEGEESAPASEPATPTSEESDSAGMPTLCVINAGNTEGARGRLAAQLEGAGYTIKDVTLPGSLENNLRGGGFVENTIFYDDGQQAAAEALAELIEPAPSVEARAGRTSQCEGEVVVFVVDGYGPE